MKYSVASIVALAGSAASSPLAQRLPGFLPLELTQNLPAPKTNPIVPASFHPASQSPASPFSAPKIDFPIGPNYGKTPTTAPTKTIDPFLEKPNVPTWWPILKIPIPVADTPPATPAASSSPTIPLALLIPAPPSNTWHSTLAVASSSTTSLVKSNTFVTKPVPAAASWSPNKEHVFSNLYTTITIPVVPDTTFATSTASSTPKAYHVISSLYTTTTTPAAAKTTPISKTTDKTSWSTSSASSTPSKNAAVAILPTTSSTLTTSYTSTTSIVPTPVAPSSSASLSSSAPSSSSTSSYSSAPLPSSISSTTPLPALKTPIPLSPLPAATKQDLSNLKTQLKAVASTLGKTISTFSHNSQKVSDKLKKLRKWSKEDFNSITRLKAVVDVQTQILVKMKEKIDKVEGENGRLREEVEEIKKEKARVEEEEEEKVDEVYSDDEGADGTVEKLVVGSNEGGHLGEKSQQEVVSGPEAPEEQQTPVIPESAAEQIQPVEEYKESYQTEGAYSPEQMEEETVDGYMYQDDGPGWYDGVWEGGEVPWTRS